MSILTRQYICHPGRRSGHSALQLPGKTASPAGFPQTMLDRNIREVRGSAWREIIADENHRFQGERLTAIAGSPREHEQFLRGAIQQGKMLSACCDYNIRGMLREDFKAAPKED